MQTRLSTFLCLVTAAISGYATSAAEQAVLGHAPITGPLRVCAANPRYFADPAGQPVYLTGSHTWSNFQDSGANDPPPAFDYDRYLEWLVGLNHNFIRLWVWEQARWAPWSDSRDGRPTDWFVSPAWAYPRTGPGDALDGKLKFDLSQFEQAYFDRLRERVKKASDRGIYVSVMLFQGWSYNRPGKGGWMSGKPWPAHPYHPRNNVQGFNGNLKADTSPDLNDPRVREHHAAYIRKVVDTLNDLDNVLYEVMNEGGNKDWDWWVVNTVQAYQKQKPKQHPVGITGHGGESNDDLLASPADWVSLGSKHWPDLKANPRAVDGRKVSLLDTDHVFGVGGDPRWVWTSFLRGHNVLFMDPYGDQEWMPVLAKSWPAAKQDHDATRRAMGHTRRYAERMDLTKAVPQPSLATTSYCLAKVDPRDPQYLVYLPAAGSVTVDLSGTQGKLAVEWFHPETGESHKGKVVQGGGSVQFQTPFAAKDAVLYLCRTE